MLEDYPRVQHEVQRTNPGMHLALVHHTTLEANEVKIMSIFKKSFLTELEEMWLMHLVYTFLK